MRKQFDEMESNKQQQQLELPPVNNDRPRRPSEVERHQALTRTEKQHFKEVQTLKDHIEKEKNRYEFSIIILLIVRTATCTKRYRYGKYINS